MKLYKRDGSPYWQYKFVYKTRRYRGSTNLKNKVDAQTAANKVREEVIKGNMEILVKTPPPQLSAFLRESFFPFIEAKHKSKKKTYEYYFYGAQKLIEDRELCALEISEITEEHSSKFATKLRKSMSVSGVNQALRTLRRALRLAFKWGKIDRLPQIPIMKGERMRRRVITAEEEKKYFAACSEPWKTIATLMIELGPRPSELLALRCEDVHWDQFSIDITDGKTHAAIRTLPLTDPAYDKLLHWWTAIGKPEAGYMFPAVGSGSCHVGRAAAREARQRGGCARRTDEDMYRASIAKAGADSKKYSVQRVHHWHHNALETSGLDTVEKGKKEKWVPYHLRHSALTRVAAKCENPFAVAAIAGHSTITMTSRYVHPEKAEIWAAFERKGGHKIGHSARRKNLKVVGEGKDES
jgi:integrase